MALSLLAVGDNVVDCYPDLGVMYPGGNAVNVAVHARRIGADAAYLGAVGTDAAGDLVRGALAAEGVDLTLARTVPGPNAYAMVRVVDGNRVFGAGEVGVSAFRLTAEDLAAAGVFDVVHTGECSMIEDDLPALAGAARLLSFDFSERPFDYIEAYAPLAGVAVVSLPDGDVDAAAALAHRVSRLGPPVVAVTVGANGAVLLSRGQLAVSPAGDVRVVDTLGAGDAFIARLLTGLARGDGAGQTVTAAAWYASRTCQSYGAFGHRAPLQSALATSEHTGAPHDT